MFYVMCIVIIFLIAAVVSACIGDKVCDLAHKVVGIFKDEAKDGDEPKEERNGE